MTIDIAFTATTPEIATARAALARLGRHLDAVLGPLSESLLATDLAFAVLGLEDVHPPYPPLPEDPEPSDDPAADFASAVAALLVAGSQASGAQDILRFAYVVRDLRAMEADPDFAAALAADSSGR